MTKTKSNVKKHYNWLMGADMYLATSCILCNEMLKSFTSPIACLNNDQQIDKKCEFTSVNPDYEMLLPAVFNLKHGIELYLKALTMTINENVEYPEGHDILKIAKNLKKELKAESCKKLLNETIPVVEKYYYGTYAFTKNKNCPDKKNEAERYPEYKNKSCYEICNLFIIVNCDLVKSIKKDCQKVQKNFREIYKKI